MTIHRGSRRQGFTLTELMIVIAIIGILAGIMMPNMIRSRNDAKLAGCKSNIRSMATALEAYATNNGGVYPTGINRVIPDFLAAIPKCPSAGTTTPYNTGYTVSTAPSNSFTLICAGANHTGSGVSSGYPQYIAGKGLIDK